jgi:phospholipid-transporting ATPase
MATVAAIFGTSWVLNNENAEYLDSSADKKYDPIGLFFSTLGTWVLIFTNFVPISMFVTLEVVKFWQGSFMQYDFTMYDQS